MEIYLVTTLDESLSLPSITMKTVKIELDKPVNPKKVKVDKRKNTGIQVAISDDPFPVVTHIQALTREELPREYLESSLPKVWLEDDMLFTETNYVLLQKKLPYSRREIAAALLYIRLAGEHLAAIKSKEQYLKPCQAATFKDGRFV